MKKFQTSLNVLSPESNTRPKKIDNNDKTNH